MNSWRNSRLATRGAAALGSANEEEEEEEVNDGGGPPPSQLDALVEQVATCTFATP